MLKLVGKGVEFVYKGEKMLKRKAMDELITWKQTKTKQGMLVEGARQVGKTYLIRAFAEANYEYFTEINLFENKVAAETLAAADNTANLIKMISLLADSKLVPGKTLIFLMKYRNIKRLLLPSNSLWNKRSTILSYPVPCSVLN